MKEISRKGTMNEMQIKLLRKVWLLMATMKLRMNMKMRTVKTATPTPRMMSGLPAAPLLPMIGTNIVKINWIR